MKSLANLRLVRLIVNGLRSDINLSVSKAAACSPLAHFIEFEIFADFCLVLVAIQKRLWRLLEY
jgi:hypothetical protein